MAIVRRRRLLEMHRLDEKTWSLQAEVEKKIQYLLDGGQVNNADKPPPFSVPEMIVIAIVMSGKESPSASEIFGEMLKRFRLYNQKALDEYMAGYTLDWSYICNGPPMLPGFYEGFNTWEAPLYGAENDSVVTSEISETKGYRIRSPIAEASIYLRKHLKYDHPRRLAQATSILDLPPEMIKIIFEYVLNFGYPGLIISEEGFRMYRRKNENAVVSASVNSATLRGPGIQTLMALFSVNKQCYNEALPIFYSKKWFAFDTPYEFAKFVQHTTDERLALMKIVIVQFSSTFRTLKGYKLGANTLSKQKRLKNLEVVVSDGTWFDTKTIHEECRYGAKVFTKPHELSGISNIAFALNNASNFKIIGDCPKVKTYLMTEVAKLKLGEKVKEVDGLRRDEKLREARSFNEAEGVAEKETKGHGPEKRGSTARGTSSGRSSSGSGGSSARAGKSSTASQAPVRESRKRSRGSASGDVVSDGPSSKRRRER